MLAFYALVICTVVAGEYENNIDVPKTTVRKCAKSGDSISYVNEDGHPVAIMNDSADCEDTNHCYALFMDDPYNSSNVIVMGQGKTYNACIRITI